MLLRLSVLLSMFVLYSCTAAVNSKSLLSENTPCTENCSTSTPGTISGDLMILPDEGEIFASPEGSDLVEITGACKDLGRKANRILVQVFEGEDDSVAPIIDNSIGVTCQSNISTSSLAASPDPCIYVSQGIGLADTGNTISQFPQCFNGRFSFQIRLGRIIRRNATLNDQVEDTNPKVRYLVKMKLRTTDGVTADSAASMMTVNRALQTPIFSVTPNRDNDRCEINFNPSKFRDVRYSLYTTWTGATWAASGTFTNTVSGPVYVDKAPTFPPLGDGTTVEKFYHFGQPLGPLIGLMPGVKYSYRMQSTDYSYTTDYTAVFGAGRNELSPMSGEVSCTMTPAYVGKRTLNNAGTGTPNSCILELAGFNTRGYSIEWRVSDTSPTWMLTNPESGFLVSFGADTYTNCRGLSTCVVHGDRDPAVFAGSASATTYIDGVPKPFKPNVVYYFAARHFRDTVVANGVVDPGEFVGDWSPDTKATGSDDYNHGCRFNTFPVQ